MKTYLLTGLTGVGKSSFINYAIGAEKAAVHRHRACTKVVQTYPAEGVRFLDSPGLGEDQGQHDGTYLGLVKDAVRDVRLNGLIYLTRLSNARLRDAEQKALVSLTEKLGAAVWQSAWLVMTCAAGVAREDRAEYAEYRLRERTALLQELTAVPVRGPRFCGFRGALLVDNYVPDWAAAGRPLLDFFQEGASGGGVRGPVAESYFPLVRYCEDLHPAAAEVS